MNRVVSRLGLTAIAIVAGSVAGYAQSSTTGAVNGVVSDDKGAPLAGATVTFTSAQVTRTATTGSDGSYRLSLLNPGAWSVRVSKDGYQAVSQKVDVATNESRSFSPKLSPVGSTVVVITSALPTVDVTNLTQGLNVSLDSIRSVPTGRSMNDLAFLAPGVVDSGFGDPSIGGGSGAENKYILDGLNTTDYNRGFQGTSLVTDFIDQVDVQTGGFKPEYSALGGVFNVVTKSGSNDFQGSAWTTWDARGIHAGLERNDVYQENAAASRYDVGAEVRGPIIKDKLFYFVGADANIAETAAGQPNFEGFVPSKAKNHTYQFVGKLNWYLTQDMQLVFFYNHNRISSGQEYNPGTNGPANAGGGHTKFNQDNVNLTYLWNITPSTLLNARVGYIHTKSFFDPTDPRALVNNRTFYGDGTPYFQSGGPGYNHDDTKVFQTAVDLAQYLGNHELKGGLAWLTSKTQTDTGGNGEPLSAAVLTGFPEIANYGVVGINASGFRTSLGGGGVRATYYSDHDNGKSIQGAFYLQDTWQIFSGFRLAFGFRYETQKVEGLGGKTVFSFTNFSENIQPRIGFTWDVNNDGKTKVSANYGRYFESIPTRLAIRSYGNETYLRLYAPLAGGYNPSAANGVGVIDYDHTLRPTSTYYGYINYSTPFTDDPIAHGIKLPRRNEVVAGIEHSFDNGISVGLHGRHRELTQAIEDSSISDSNNVPLYNKSIIYNDPYGLITGAPGVYYAGAIIWNPGSHVSFTTAPNSIDRANGITEISVDTPFPHAKNTYDSVDLTIDKKTDRAYISFSYTWSRLEGNYEGVVSSSNGQADGNITALFDDWNYIGYGLLPLDRTNVAKLFGSYRWTIGNGDFTAGFNVQYTDGTPRTFLGGGVLSNAGYPDPLAYGNATPHNGVYGGDGRNPATINTDLNLTYAMKFGRYKVAPFAQVFNLFNMRRPTSYDDAITDSAGDLSTTFGAISSWQEGRRYRFGLKVQF